MNIFTFTTLFLQFLPEPTLAGARRFHPPRRPQPRFIRGSPIFLLLFFYFIYLLGSYGSNDFSQSYDTSFGDTSSYGYDDTYLNVDYDDTSYVNINYDDTSYVSIDSGPHYNSPSYGGRNRVVAGPWSLISLHFVFVINCV